MSAVVRVWGRGRPATRHKTRAPEVNISFWQLSCLVKQKEKKKKKGNCEIVRFIWTVMPSAPLSEDLQCMINDDSEDKTIEVPRNWIPHSHFSFSFRSFIFFL